MPVVAFLAGLIVVAGLIGSPGETEFYRAAATVIPTLLLTLAVQGKFFRLSDLAKSPLHQALQGKQISRDDLKRLGATSFQAWTMYRTMKSTTSQMASQTRQAILLLLSILAVGGGCALYALASGQEAAVLLGTVSGAIAAGIFAIAGLAILDVESQVRAPDATPEEATTGWRDVLTELAERRTEAAAAEGQAPVME